MRSLGWTLNSCWWCSGPNYPCWLQYTYTQKHTNTEHPDGTGHKPTNTHKHKHSEISIVSLSAIISVSPFFFTMHNQWQSMYQSAIRLQLAGGHILPRSASFSCWSWLPACSPACTIPCQSNLPGNLEQATVSHRGALNRDVAWLLFGLFSSCWSSVAPLLFLYAPLNLFRCTSVSR